MVSLKLVYKYLAKSIFFIKNKFFFFFLAEEDKLEFYFIPHSNLSKILFKGLLFGYYTKITQLKL